MKMDFTRSNVSEETLNVSQPRRSSFDHYHRKDLSLPIGRFLPVNVQTLMPSSVLAGEIKPEFALENVVFPTVGPLRLDTHTVAVSARRINQDWRRLIEGTIDTIPSFVPADLFRRVCDFLVDGEPWSTYCTFVDGESKFAISSFVSDVRSRYQDMILSTAPDDGYLKDFFAAEIVRLGSVTVPSGDLPLYVALPFIHSVLEPYFGEGSIMDMLGYPIFGYYSSNFHQLLDFFKTRASGYDATGWNWDNLFQFSSYSKRGAVSVKFEYGNIPMNEMPIRASFAAWYDALRNWHVEERSKLPNPDLWGSTSILGVDQPFLSLVCFLVPRYRCFGKDAFTTVQTDDIFRHVFSPIWSAISESPDDSWSSSSSSDNQSVIMNSVYSVLINGVNSVFPQGLFRRDSSDFVTDKLFMQDLQTMRRAGMLEKYLARDYFFPDTYEGQMRARWGVDASDLLGCTSRYISGSESFISGEQKIAASGTDGVNGTPAGTRTFVGGAAGSEKIQFSSGGDFVYLVTFASLQPIVTYDAMDMHLAEVTRADLPFPEFADDTRVQIKASDMIRGSVDSGLYLGYVPRYFQYRTAMDSVHGRFLRDYRGFVWLRDWFATQALDNEEVGASPFTISAYGLHVHVAMDAFLGDLGEWSHVAYGNIKFNVAVDCPLPAAVEYI